MFSGGYKMRTLARNGLISFGEDLMYSSEKSQCWFLKGNKSIHIQLISEYGFQDYNCEC